MRGYAAINAATDRLESSCSRIINPGLLGPEIKLEYVISFRYRVKLTIEPSIHLARDDGCGGWRRGLRETPVFGVLVPDNHLHSKDVFGDGTDLYI
jgi:hypothetical protein